VESHVRENELSIMSQPTDHLFIVTGGPGSGKSTLVAALSQAGYSTSVEAGRAIIQDQVAIGGNALPWGDRAAFAEQMLCWEMRSYRIALGQGAHPAFFDRGVPDVVGYLRLCGLPVPAHIDKAAKLLRYNRRVFIAPPWKAIFRQDAERKQTFDEAVATYEALVETYNTYDYELVALPLGPVEKRLAAVLAVTGTR
jgi:predicted ATPase